MGEKRRGRKKKKRTKKEKFNGVTAVALTAVDLGADGEAIGCTHSTHCCGQSS